MLSAILETIRRAGKPMCLADLERELGIDVTARLLTIDDVLGADELFLTNSSWGVLPVTAVEASAIGG